jgi:uncharacterized protein YdaU (DUF1376 family)
MMRVSPKAFFIGKVMHYYQFNIGDYISHTSHLTNDEDLTYRRLLDLYYQTEKSFSIADLPKIARKVKSNEEIVMLILHEFFEFNVDDNSWHNKRADSEIKAYQSKADSARKANQIRWGSERHLKSDTTQILNNKQETINNIKDIRPSDVDLLIWQDFVKHRKAKKSPITETALNMIRTEANKANWKLQDALTEICSRGWTGFKADWVNKTQDSKPAFDGRLRGAK